MYDVFEVQTFMLGNWENTWSVNDQPLFFSTKRLAFDAIDQFFDDLKESGLYDQYAREDYRVSQIGVLETGADIQ